MTHGSRRIDSVRCAGDRTRGDVRTVPYVAAARRFGYPASGMAARIRAVSAVLAVACCVLACGTSANDVFSSRIAADAIADDTGDAPPPPTDAPGGGSGISVDPSTLAIVGTPGSSAMATAMVTGVGGVQDLTAVELVDPNLPPRFKFVQPSCATQSCAFPALSILLPTALELACLPGSVKAFAMVTVRSGAFSDTAQVTCSATASGPAFEVPGMFGPLSTQVGSTVAAPLTITNSGSDPIEISLVFDPASDWNATMCVAPNRCLIQVGSNLTVPVALTPTAHGPRDSMLAVSSFPDVGTKSVTLVGTGFGGVLEVLAPAAPFQHNFGTIAKNQLSSFAVTMTNPGNDGITVTPSDPGAPYVVDTAGIGLNPNNGGIGTFTISCKSATAGGPFDATITLGATPNTYARNTSKIDVRCAIADTTVQVTPTPLDFQELRKDGPAGVIEVTLTNPPGGATAIIKSLRLRNEPAALSLAPTSSTLPATLAPGATLTTRLELATTEDLVLTDVLLEVLVNEGTDATLELPITGKVGTPSARVIPDNLALGTVCVGTPVTGIVTLTNNGTATLHVMRPTMDSASFTPLLQNPTEYPPGGFELSPNGDAVVGIMAVTSAAGPIRATLEWPVDLPASPFRIPVTLDYIASGTAVSPERLEFGGIAVAAMTATQTVTLENCGATPVLVSVQGVDADEGSASAWLIEPRTQRSLLPDETMKITAAFAPSKPGHHEANLEIDVDGEPRIVRLIGDAVGEQLEQTSFYACGCSGSGAPGAGWPILFALALVLRRRC